MALIDIAVDTVTHAPTAGMFRAFARWLADARAESKRRATLRSLLFTPEHRLRDLGISRDELIRAIERRR
ncbi:MAG: hypothetical protein WBA73_00395 [Devosia sp.]